MILQLFHICILKLDAGDWGFIPMHGDKTYKAYATTNPTSIEFMVIGKDQ